MVKKLLIARDSTILVPYTALEDMPGEPKVIAKEPLPEELQQPLIVHPAFINVSRERELTDLVVQHTFIPKKIKTNIKLPFSHAVWSGRRSILFCTDWANGAQMYKLKGVSFTYPLEIVKPVSPRDEYVWGAQERFSAQEESRFAKRFSKVLADHGIDPVMNVIGYYEWPVRFKRKKLVASICKVAGDTRVDELKLVIEKLVDQHCNRFGHCMPMSLEKDISSFFYDVGRNIGQMKRLFDRNNLTWSAESDSTNAHLGNVVLYRTSKRELAVGFVDFDAACDNKYFSKRAMKEQQKAEYNSLLDSITDFLATSIRLLHPLNSCYYPTNYIKVNSFLRNGFIEGYERFSATARRKEDRELNPVIDEERLNIILSLLVNPLIREEKREKQIKDSVNTAIITHYKKFRVPALVKPS